MKWRMTYNVINAAACSARGIAHRNSKKELEKLANELSETITNIQIQQINENESHRSNNH